MTNRNAIGTLLPPCLGERTLSEKMTSSCYTDTLRNQSWLAKKSTMNEGFHGKHIYNKRINGWILHLPCLITTGVHYDLLHCQVSKILG